MLGAACCVRSTGVIMRLNAARTSTLASTPEDATVRTEPWLGRPKVAVAGVPLMV